MQLGNGVFTSGFWHSCSCCQKEEEQECEITKSAWYGKQLAECGSESDEESDDEQEG